MTSLQQFRVLTNEAIRDAFRRRVVTTIIIVTLFSLGLMDGCTSCVPTDLELNGQSISELGWVGIAGMVIFGSIALWMVVLSGLLASDHLTETIDDGSAALFLSKAIDRRTFALSRLAGSLSVSLATSTLLLTAAALFIWNRHDLELAPAALAALMTFGSSVVVAAFAMTLSLYFRRIATFLTSFFLVIGISIINVQALVGGELTGLTRIVNFYGPPFGTSIAVALYPWTGQPLELMLSIPVYFRLVVWMGLAIGLMVFAFRRVDVPA